MIHVNLSTLWLFSEEPFPAYRCDLTFGRNKRDFQFLPVKDVAPVVTYSVIVKGSTLYSGKVKADAESVKSAFDAEQQQKGDWSRAEIKASLPTMPAGRFKLITTKGKGTVMVVPGEDVTDRCLLFVGASGGFRGGVTLLPDGTSDEVILKECAASNNCESGIEVIAILSPGQTVAFHATGRRTDQVYLYTWTGVEVEQKTFTWEEWQQRSLISEEPSDAVTL